MRVAERVELPELQQRGLTTDSKILEIYDATATLGGAIMRDKLWFYTSHREWGNRHQMAGVFWNATQGTPFWTPDPNRPADRYQWYESHLGRITWQATPRNKSTFVSSTRHVQCRCRRDRIGAGVGTRVTLPPERPVQARGRRPHQQAAARGGRSEALRMAQYLAPGVEPHHMSIYEQSTVSLQRPATFLPVREKIGSRAVSVSLSHGDTHLRPDPDGAGLRLADEWRATSTIASTTESRTRSRIRDPHDEGALSDSHLRAGSMVGRKLTLTWAPFD